MRNKVDLKRSVLEIPFLARALARRNGVPKYADPNTLGKAIISCERFREILSDPLNLLIERVPSAGYVNGKKEVILHNGITVPVFGPLAYYGKFSEILILNRGVHEPLEEFCFQQLMKKPAAGQPVMLELGAYWGHYSMWFKQSIEAGRCILVEPDGRNIKAGISNFENNGMQAKFIKDAVGRGGFHVDQYVAREQIDHIYLLHSDIQGAEVEMLEDTARSLNARKVSYVFVSTHGADIHSRCEEILAGHGYRIEVSSEPNCHATSYDGFILASSPEVVPVFDDFRPLGRTEIADANAKTLVSYLDSTILK